MLAKQSLARATVTLAVAAVLALALAPASPDAQSPSPQARAPRFNSVSVGQHFSCGLTFYGEPFCWGANYYGQLGARSSPPIAPCPEASDLVSTCALLPAAVATTHRFTNLSAGLKHVCAVDTEKAVWCWGRNHANQLGAESADQCTPRASARGEEEFASSPCSFEPVQVEALPASRLVAGGDDFSCALSDEGAIWCWGGDAGVQPMQVSGSDRFLDISAGYTNVCGTTNDARAACWSLYGGLSQAKWADVTEGLRSIVTSNHTCAIGIESKRAYCWGFNAHGSLGTGSHKGSETLNEPTPVAGELEFAELAVSFLGTCGLESSGGLLFCWGSPPAGPTPDRCTSGGEFWRWSRCALSPQAVFPMNLGSLAIAVSHGCAIAATSNAYCWGANDFGELGNGTTNNALDTPLVVGVQALGSSGLSSRLSALGSAGTVLMFGIVALLAVVAVRALRSRRA